MAWINNVFYDLSQSPTWSVDWAVSIDGTDRTSSMRPYLIDISITDKEGTASDSCNLTFDDTDGEIELDMEGADIAVSLNGIEVFVGTVETARSTGSRGGGRLVPVTAKGFDTRGKAKELQAFHLDDASLEEFLRQAAQNAGYEISVQGDLAGVRRDYWSADHESFLDLGERMKRELSATFKLRGKQAVLVPRGTALLPTVQGLVGSGGNVISWDLAPFTGRPAYSKAQARFFDRKQAKWLNEEVEIDLGRNVPEAVNMTRMPMADADQAKLRAGGRRGEAKREAGGGTVMLDLTPDAQAEAPFQLTGARADIDGGWKIVGVTHKANRAGGGTTNLDLKEPGADANQEGQ